MGLPARRGEDGKQIRPEDGDGGMIMVHDYTDTGLFPGTRKAIDTFLSDKPERVAECYGIIATIVKQPATRRTKLHKRACRDKM